MTWQRQCMNRSTQPPPFSFHYVIQGPFLMCSVSRSDQLDWQHLFQKGQFQKTFPEKPVQKYLPIKTCPDKAAMTILHSRWG